MSSKSLAQGKLRQLLIDAHGIRFRPDIEPKEWPSNFQKHFQHIQALGSTKFDAWEEDVDANWKQYPWKLDTKKRAKKIIANARRCRDHQLNERTWRSEIEPEVFKRFSEDGSCQRCHARIWRSEIDPRTGSAEDSTEETLAFSNDSCQCGLVGPDAGEPGYSKMFTMREDARVEYDEDEQRLLDRKWEAPDKILALHATGTLQEYMRNANRREGQSGPTLDETLQPTLFPKETHPALFPFLLGESKSEASSASLSTINRQMALVIKKSLDIQERLRILAGSESHLVAGSLVWCLSHHGPSWRVSAGYMMNKRTIKVQISTLWHGLITDLSGALQLLLIVDYICDWARYIHREAMIHRLRAAILPFIDDFSDIFSSGGPTVASQHGRRAAFERAPSTLISGNVLNRSPEPSLQAQQQERRERIAMWKVSQSDHSPNMQVGEGLLCIYDLSETDDENDGDGDASDSGGSIHSNDDSIFIRVGTEWHRIP